MTFKETQEAIAEACKLAETPLRPVLDIDLRGVFAACVGLLVERKLMCKACATEILWTAGSCACEIRGGGRSGWR